MNLKTFLNSKYNPEKFIFFLSERFYGFEPNIASHTNEDLSESEKREIESYRYLGNIELDDGKEIGFFEFLSKTPNIENKRVGFNKILKKLAEEYMLDGAIASFYHPNSNAWRLSFVGFEYDEGRAKVTNLKRYTYVLGENIPVKTAYMQLKNLKYPKFEELKEIFSVERVTKEFYKGLEKLYFKLLNNILYPSNDENKKKEFVIKLIGRLIFIKFLEKKGLIKNNIFEVKENYYFEVLEPLFFEQLNKPNNERFGKFKNENIPFLNGGLFEPIKEIDYYEFDEDLEERVPIILGKLKIEDEFFNELFSHFSQFNFTVDENSSEDNELSIDPEMLGRIFENFIAEINPETSKNARKATGSYYTPREIVDYMVSESLLEYLKANTKVEYEKLKKLMYEEVSLKTYEKTDILTALFKVKILDPACGSGAFPMGILQKILKILKTIDEDGTIWLNLQSKEFREKYKDKDINYFRKISIVNNSIFGIDIQPIAIEIAKLRFFLSLIVEEKVDKDKENLGIEPLPNLEFKFVCANTLIPLTQKDAALRTDNYYKYLEELKELKNRYFLSYAEEKEKIKKEYKKIQNKLFEELSFHNLGEAITDNLVNYNPFYPLSVAEFFDSEFMFNVTDGFDIVIGNPPYIDSEAMKKNFPFLREKIRANYKYTKGNWDIYIAFFELGLNLLGKSGNLIYITPDKWLSKPFGRELRKNCYKKIILILKAGRECFESAKVDSIITQFSSNDIKTLKVYEFINNKVMFLRKLDKSLIKDDYRLDFIFSKYLEILLKIESQPLKLKDFWKCENACATSDAYKLKDLLKDNCSYDLVKYLKVINTGTISKFLDLWGKKEMTYLKDKYLCPIVSIDEFKKNFNSTYINRALSKKLIIKGLTLLDGCVDFQGNIIPGKSTLIIKENNKKRLKLLSALINSKLYIFYIKEKYSGSSYNQGINFTKDMINEIPIINIKQINTKPFEILVDYIIFLKQQNLKKLGIKYELMPVYFEQIIDGMVFELYFKDLLKKNNREIIKYLDNLLDISNIPDEKKLDIIKKVFDELNDLKHPLRNNLFYLDSISEIRTIKESK